MKHLVTTRWSARYEAIRAVKTGFQALNSLTSASENLQTRRERANNFAFVFKLLLHVTFVLLGRNSWANESHPKETSRTWYWFGYVCNPHGCDENVL